MNTDKAKGHMSEKRSPEQLVEILGKLYAARRSAKGLLGDKFAEQMKVFQGFIRARQAKDNCEEMTASARIVAGLQKEKPGSEVTQMYVLAALVEMIEPSESSPSV
jgi:hypothetical protein